ncbi:Uncharacterised protein [Mycobacterium tuberculosis]|nr:Uncharacterised protein [Mycobacterium tuberculosis]
MPAGSPVRLATEVCMRSSSRRMLRALSTMMSPALVSCTRLPMRCKSGVPVSFSRVAICWETAEGVRLSASAAAMTVPRSWISRSICIRRMS